MIKLNSLETYEKELRSSLPARIIELIAVHSKCIDPARIIKLYHRKLIIAALINPVAYAARPGVSIRERLEPGATYPGGDPLVIEAGLLVLEMISLIDHLTDIEKDRTMGKYNPLFSDLDYFSEYDRITKQYHKIPTEKRIYFKDCYQEAKIKKGWW